MNNNNFEFKNYIPTPNDQYMLGVAKVKLYGKVVANFKHVKTKDGQGDFFCSASYSILDATGEKKYISCVLLDSRDDEEALMEFIRENVHAVIAQRSIQKMHPVLTAAVHYPHGMVANSMQQATSMSEVAQNDSLPF